MSEKNIVGVLNINGLDWTVDDVKKLGNYTKSLEKKLVHVCLAVGLTPEQIENTSGIKVDPTTEINFEKQALTSKQGVVTSE